MKTATKIILNGEEISREEAIRIYGQEKYDYLERESYDDYLMDPTVNLPFFGENGLLRLFFN